jgi:hypothetical protein
LFCKNSRERSGDVMENVYSDTNLGDLKIAATEQPILTLQNPSIEIMRFELNGDIYIKGKLVTNDMEIVQGMRTMLKSQGYIKD